MSEVPAAPAPPDIEVERGIRLDELPVAETELESTNIAPYWRKCLQTDGSSYHM